MRSMTKKKKVVKEEVALKAAAFNTWRKLKQALVNPETSVTFKVPGDFKHPAELPGHLNLPPEVQAKIAAEAAADAEFKLPKSLEDYFARNLNPDEVARFSKIANSLVEKLQSGEWRVEDVDLDTKAKELVLTVAEKQSLAAKRKAATKVKKPSVEKKPVAKSKKTRKS